jgi:hypothetical protein
VSCRRSAADPESAGVDEAASGATVVVEMLASLVPQLAQNLAFGGFFFPQEEHASGSGAPHSTQNLLSAESSALQFGHSIPHLDVLSKRPIQEGTKR